MAIMIVVVMAMDILIIILNIIMCVHLRKVCESSNYFGDGLGGGITFDEIEPNIILKFLGLG